MTISNAISPELSIIVPAYNEEELLPGTLESARAAVAGCGLSDSVEIIVVDNNSTDGTAKSAARLGTRVVFEPQNQISRARNAGGRAAIGKFLVFLDADTELTAALLGRALENLRSGSCCGGGVVLKMDRETTPAAARIISGWNGLSRKLGLAAGCFIYCPREGFTAVGGFSEGVYAGEEIWFSRALKKWGRKRGQQFRVITDVTISTSSRKLEWFSAGQLMLQSAVLIVFPWATRSRRFCRIWYKRPHLPLQSDAAP